MEDIKLKCFTCGKDFIFTVNEQKFYEEKGFVHPKNCKTCRNARAQRRLERRPM